ncbi:aspartic peptidase domain-containing protein [Roridomyces roridus]|uniref:Aspartic peptidase domain-containing protein n=1 Tax=Roridomyces roridus TaxID=1738132 RepID=A0AAD7CGT8_9AGAR|nr:aspartic peptidase domain-containing protein [Roridomyces roridus]
MLSFRLWLAATLLAGALQCWAITVNLTEVTVRAVLNASLPSPADPVLIGYATNITVNGHDFSVLLDTGSADLWILTPAGFAFNDTNIPVRNQFSSGDVDGTVGFASVQLGGYTVDQQAFNTAKTVQAQSLLALGFDGVLGLSYEFTGPPSAIVDAVVNTLKNSTIAAPFIVNVAREDPFTGSPTVTLSLPRVGNCIGCGGTGTLELPGLNGVVSNQTALPAPLFPQGNVGVWSVLVDGLSLNNESIGAVPNSIVSGAPTGSLVMRLDSGVPTGVLPQALLDTIYSGIPGSRLKTVSGVSTSSGQVWTVPCNSTTVLSLKVGPNVLPIHPLDLSTVVIDQSTHQPVCVTPFRAAQGSDGDTQDIIAGGSLMQNFEAIFNLGSLASSAHNETPSIQLISRVDLTLVDGDVGFQRGQLVKVDSNRSGPAAVAGFCGVYVAFLLGLVFVL